MPVRRGGFRLRLVGQLCAGLRELGVEVAFLNGSREHLPKGYIVLEFDKTGRTTKKGMFAGGDIVTGAATVISAAGAGRDGGMAIVKFLKDGEWWDPNAPKPEEAPAAKWQSPLPPFKRGDDGSPLWQRGIKGDSRHGSRALLRRQDRGGLFCPRHRNPVSEVDPGGNSRAAGSMSE